MKLSFSFIKNVIFAILFCLCAITVISTVIILVKNQMFIIPGVSPKYYAQDSVIPVLTYGLFSPKEHPNEPISYKTLPVCAPLQGWSAVQSTLGEIIKHEEILYTFYYVMVGVNMTDPTLTVCSTYLSEEPEHRYHQLKNTYKAILGDYRYVFTLDGLEVLYPNMNGLERYTVFGDKDMVPISNWPDNMIPTIEYENVTRSVSTSEEEETKNHTIELLIIDDSNAYQFPIIPDSILKKAKNTIGLPVGFMISRHDDIRGPRGYYMYQHYNFYIYYKEETMKVRPSDDVWIYLTNEERAAGEATLVSILRFEGYPEPRSAVLILPADGNLTQIPDTIKTTYGYVLIEDDGNWVSRWSSLLYSSKTQIDAMAIIDIVTSCIMFLIFILLVIFLWWHIRASMRYKLQDFIVNTENRLWLFHFDATQWRHMNIDFFREPILSGLGILLMSAGSQYILSFIATLMAGSLGLFFGNLQGGLDETLMIVYMFMYLVGGMVSGFFRYTWSRSIDQKNHTLFCIVTWSLFPGIPVWFFIFSTLSLHLLVGTPLPHMETVFLSIGIWVIITLILTVAGFYVGEKICASDSVVNNIWKWIRCVSCTKLINKRKQHSFKREIELHENDFVNLCENPTNTTTNTSSELLSIESSSSNNNSEIKTGIENILNEADNVINKINSDAEYTQKIIDNSSVPMTIISVPPVPMMKLDSSDEDDEIDKEIKKFVYKQRKYYDKWKDDVLTREKIVYKSSYIPKLWSKTKWLWTIMFGFISYMMVSVSVHTFLRSSWGPYVDTMYLTTLINILTWCLFVAACANMFVYIHLNNRDWRWFWSCFMFSGSCSIFYFIHTIIYLLFFSDMSGLVTIIYYLLFSTMTTCAIFISMGSIGCITTYFVFRKLYKSAISKDD